MLDFRLDISWIITLKIGEYEEVTNRCLVTFRPFSIENLVFATKSPKGEQTSLDYKITGNMSLLK